MITDPSVPTRLAGALSRTPVLEVSRTHGLVRIPGVGRYLVAPGEPVRVSAEAAASEADLACFRDGPVRALELLLGGVFALRGAAVRLGAGAVVICGMSGVGKSALAAALAVRGNPLLADKLVPLPSGSHVAPTADATELWPAMAAHLGLLDQPSAVVRPVLAKRAYRLGPPRAPSAVPVSLIVLLGTDPRVEVATATEVGSGLERVRVVASCQAHRRLVPLLGGSLEHFDWLAALGGVPMLRLSRPRRGLTVAALADLVEAAAE